MWVQASRESSSGRSRAEASHVDTSLLLISQRAALASRSLAVIDFALENFMTLLEIIKRTNIKFSHNKINCSAFPTSIQRQSAVPLSEQTDS